MKGKGRAEETSGNPWTFLVSLSLFLLSIPSLSLADKCTGVTKDIALSYNLLDEFGEQTSVARIDGTLVITCVNPGSQLPDLWGGTSRIPDTVAKREPGGKFRIRIQAETAKVVREEIKCYCGGKTTLRSRHDVLIEHILCSPSLTQNCTNTQLCRLESDGNGGMCESSADVCVDAPSVPSTYPYRLLGISMEYCTALKKAENEEWGQVEVQKTTNDSSFRKFDLLLIYCG